MIPPMNKKQTEKAITICTRIVRGTKIMRVIMTQPGRSHQLRTGTSGMRALLADLTAPPHARLRRRMIAW